MYCKLLNKTGYSPLSRHLTFKQICPGLARITSETGAAMDRMPEMCLSVPFCLLRVTLCYRISALLKGITVVGPGLQVAVVNENLFN